MAKALVVDVGGTKVSLGHIDVEVARAGVVALAGVRSYAAGAFASFDAVLARYLDDEDMTAASLEGACVAVAGPVEDRRCRATNLPWTIDARGLEARLGLAEVGLINDLEALAWAVAELGEADSAVLFAGVGPRPGNACVVAAGTGLGQAALVWDGRRHLPVASEGGHASFGPCDARERALLEFVAREHAHVSWERVASGLAIPTLYAFVVEHRGAGVGAWVEGARAEGRLAAEIAARAQAERCSICVETMSLLATLLGRATGNAALSYLARGGVYLAGGVAQRNRVLLERGEFVAGYLAHGRMRALLETIPVRLILDAEVALVGAYRALDHARNGG